MNELAKIKSFKSADGITLPYFEFKSNNKPDSAIVLIYEIFGMTNHIYNLANTFAENGFIVNVPDIFSRIEKNVALPYNREGYDKGISLKEKIGWQIPVMDIVSCASQLKRNFKVTVLGYCFGGSLGWLAMQKSFIFDKGVCYYGSSISDFLNNNINCPAMLHFGKKDKGIPAKSIGKIKTYTSLQKQDVTVHEYEDADHGFNCEDRKSYKKDAAELAFKKTLNFIKEK
jgi:carboxymethylenebutenolidase